MAQVAASSDNGLVNRMIRAARLDKALYDEVDADESATSQALTVVVIGSVASGIGGLIAGVMEGGNRGIVGGLVGSVLLAIVGWVVWSLVIYAVGAIVFHAPITYSRVLRSIGFADAPGVLLILSFVPVLGGIISLIVGLWVLVATFIATREGLELDNTKTIVTMVIAIVGFGIVYAVLGALLGLAGLGAAGALPA